MVLLFGQVHPISYRRPALALARGQHQPGTPLRRLLLALEYSRVDPFEAWMRDRFGSDHGRSRPDQCQSSDERQRHCYHTGSQVIAPVPIAPAQYRQSADCEGGKDGGGPVGWRRQVKPQADAQRERHCKPRSPIEFRTCEKCLATVGETGHRAAHAPRARHCFAGDFARLPHRYRRRPPCRHAHV